jgi:hypothetical protein
VVSAPITLCNHRLHGSRHICAFFDSREQEYAAFLPYFAEGIANGERVILIADEARHAELRDRLIGAGIDTGTAEATTQLQVLASEATYLRDGTFGRERMRALVEDALRAARDTPFRTVRTLGEMDWALRDLPGTEDLVDYECDINELLTEYDCTLACAYDLARFNGRVLLDVLCTHPQVLINGKIHENPYYTRPEEFRRARALRADAASVR